MSYKINKFEIEYVTKVTKETLIAYNKDENKKLDLSGDKPYVEMIVSTDDNKKVYHQTVYEGDYIVKLKGCSLNSFAMPKELFESLFEKVDD